MCFFKRTTKTSLKSVTHWPKELFWTLDLILHASLWQNIVIWSGHVDNIVVSAENHLCWTLKLKWSEFVGVICSFQTILWFVMNKGPNTIFREKFLVKATQKTHGFRRYNYGAENWSVSLLENDKICIILPSLWVILVYTRIAFLNIIRELRISPYLLGGKWDSNSRRL